MVRINTILKSVWFYNFSNAVGSVSRATLSEAYCSLCWGFPAYWGVRIQQTKSSGSRPTLQSRWNKQSRFKWFNYKVQHEKSVLLLAEISICTFIHQSSLTLRNKRCLRPVIDTGLITFLGRTDYSWKNHLTASNFAVVLAALRRNR